MSDSHVRWILASDKDTDGRSETRVARYLYGNAKVFHVGEHYGSDYRRQYLIVVAQGGGNIDLAADHQAERLRSGLIGARVFDTYLEAVEAYHTAEASAV